jgi:hypothetical protein
LRSELLVNWKLLNVKELKRLTSDMMPIKINKFSIFCAHCFNVGCPLVAIHIQRGSFIPLAVCRTTPTAITNRINSKHQFTNVVNLQNLLSFINNDSNWTNHLLWSEGRYSIKSGRWEVKCNATFFRDEPVNTIWDLTKSTLNDIKKF